MWGMSKHWSIFLFSWMIGTETGRSLGSKFSDDEEVFEMLDIVMVAVILGLGALMLGLIRWADSVTKKGSVK